MALIRNDLVCNGSLVEPPSAALKGYLWVADPRQVSFFCTAKRKSPKKRPPRRRRPSRYASRSAGKPGAHILVRPFALPLAALTPVLLARIGARLTRRALIKRASGSNRRRATPPILAAMLGGVYGDPKATPIWPLPFTDVSDQQVLSIGHGLMGFVPTPVGASRAAERAQGKSRASCSSPSRVVKRPAS